MTPQLQQAIKLLQLHSLELHQEIQQMLESNPMLEMEDDQDDFTPENASEKEADSDFSGDRELNLDSNDTPGNDDLPVDIIEEDSWEPMYGSSVSTSADGNERDIWETQAGLPASTLHDHLEWQLQMTNLSATDNAIAEAIIDGINEDGFLTESVEDIYQSLLKEHEELELDEVVAVLHRIQHLDPLGVGASGVQECLLLQLNALSSDTPQVELAKAMVKENIDLLATHDYARLKRIYRIKEDELATAMALIQGLTPKPGAGMTSTRTEYIVPDVFVSKHHGRWRVELNPDLAPKLRIHQVYADMVNRSDRSEDGAFMRNNLQEARWFIKSLLSRNETILKVAQAIVERQRAFLDYGDEAMKPMVLRDIAEAVDMHESTISRVTNLKYMHTPRGIYELKHFFSSHVSTSDGGECSATAIRAMIKKLIAEEDSRKPLSDSKLAKILDEQGINVARRTVAKYREGMNIPPSNERKRLN